MYAIRRLTLLMLAILAGGCARNPYLMQGQLQSLQQQQLAVAEQSRELESRANSLDRDNQQLETLLAQERQRSLVYQDQLAALREQLTSASGQVAKLSEQQSETKKKAEAMVASSRRRAGAAIAPNNSMLETLPAITLPDVTVRRDGDVIRIEMAASRLFDAGNGQLRPDAGQLIEAVALELSGTYSDHFIGIEGHTDTGMLPSGKAQNQHQLSTARATAVYDYLTARTRLRPEQLFIAGHGPNHPIVSNATPAGRERNRRVELVIYPERIARR